MLWIIFIFSDITRGKEVNPIQCVNEVDDDGFPTDFTYVVENCITTNVQVDGRISSLIVCHLIFGFKIYLRVVLNS